MPPTPSRRIVSIVVQPAALLLLRLSLLFHVVVTADYLDYSSTTKYCYSCMSEEFLAHWSFLDEVYYRPMNFTDHCFSIPSKVNIGMTPCSHSMCVTVIEPKILAGQHIGNNIIRGCFASVFKHGQGPRAQASPILDFDHSMATLEMGSEATLAKDTSCTRMPAHRLLPAHLAGRSSNRSIELCWCVGQLCNDYPSVPINAAHRREDVAFLAALLAFLISQLITNRC